MDCLVRTTILAVTLNIIYNHSYNTDVHCRLSGKNYSTLGLHYSVMCLHYCYMYIVCIHVLLCKCFMFICRYIDIGKPAVKVLWLQIMCSWYVYK